MATDSYQHPLPPSSKSLAPDPEAVGREACAWFEATGEEKRLVTLTKNVKTPVKANDMLQKTRPRLATGNYMRLEKTSDMQDWTDAPG